MSHHSEGSKGGIPITAFAVGALAGAIAGILLAPKEGSKTRAEIQTTVMKIKDDLVQKLSELKEISEDKYREIASSVVATYQASKEITADQAEAIKEDLTDGYKELKKVAEEAKGDLEEHV